MYSGQSVHKPSVHRELLEREMKLTTKGEGTGSIRASISLSGNSRFGGETSSIEQLALLTYVTSRQTSIHILVPKSQDCQG